jgi:beta-galactosidase
LDELVPIEGEWLNGTSMQWAERLKLLDPQNAIPFSRYGKSNGWLDNQIALVVHPFGSGMVYTVGAYLDERAQQTFINHVLQTAGIQPVKSEEDVEVSTRSTPEGKLIYIVINHASTVRSFIIPWPAFDHLRDQIVQNELKLPAYGVAILTRVE